MMTKIPVKKRVQQTTKLSCLSHIPKKWKMSNTILVGDENCYSVTKHLPIINFPAS
jgi:hypothetical protein